MSAPNFISYDDFPNLYALSAEAIEYEAEYFAGIVYADDPDGYADKMSAYVKENYEGYRILFEDEISHIEAALEDCNNKIQRKANRLYYESRRLVDQDEGDFLRSVSLSLEPGYYQGFQIAVNGDYKYINKTNKKMVRHLMEKVARRFYLYGYGLSYLCSNGEAGFHKTREYKPTPRELAA